MISTTVPPSSHVRFSYFLPALLCIALFVVYGVVQNTFNSVRTKNEQPSAVNKKHIPGKSNELARFNQLVATPSANTTSAELINVKAESSAKTTTTTTSSSSNTNKNERLSTTTKSEKQEYTKENTTSLKERNKKDNVHSSNNTHTNNKSSHEDVTDTTKTPCCEKETIQNYQGAKASNKDLDAYAELLSKWASTLHDAREAVKKGGTKADTAKALLDSFIDGKISKNKYDDSIKKLEL